MDLDTLLSSAAAILSFGVAAFSFFRSNRSVAYRIFTAGMLLLVMEQLAVGFDFSSSSPSMVMHRYWIDSFIKAMLPGVWLLFSISFARTNYFSFFKKWKWIALAFFTFPLCLVTIFKDSLFISATPLSAGSEWVVRLGSSGYLLHLFLLLSTVIVLMNLEKTLGAFTGGMLWRIKFTVLGIFGLFAARIYVESYVLLYSSLKTSLESINSSALIIADLLILVSLFRSRLIDADIYLSHSALFNSFVALIVGVYLAAIGLIGSTIASLGDSVSYPVDFLFAFISMVALSIFLLSGKLRQSLRRTIAHHFKRPSYDYRREWSLFTQRTSTLLNAKDLCSAVADMASDTFGVSSADLWLIDESREQFSLGGSTALSVTQAMAFHPPLESLKHLSEWIIDQAEPIDLQSVVGTSTNERVRSTLVPFINSGACLLAPLVTTSEIIGFMTLSRRMDGSPFSVEDFDLLKIIADQTAGNLLNLRLSERLQRTKEKQTFQSLSAFLAHDLKNLASSLSLTLQNLPLHYDNPEFRQDALKMMAQSVEKINTMCSRLSVLKQEIELHRTEADLNELVTGMIAGMNGCLKAALIKELHPVPRIMIDREQIQNVLLNLILNANDAVNGSGEIRVETLQRDGWIMLSVCDNGCGISREFLENSLFRPFKTTKKKGLGIGLFQSKMIVEAHRGRIDADSEEGKGTCFRIFLP